MDRPAKRAKRGEDEGENEEAATTTLSQKQRQSLFALHYHASQPTYNHPQPHLQARYLPYGTAQHYGGYDNTTHPATGPHPLSQQPVHTHSLLSVARSSTHYPTPQPSSQPGQTPRQTHSQHAVMNEYRPSTLPVDNHLPSDQPSPNTHPLTIAQAPDQQEQDPNQSPVNLWIQQMLQQNARDIPDFRKIDRVVHSAIGQAFKEGRKVTAMALNELWDLEHYQINLRIARIIQAIFSGQATEGQYLEFKNIIRHKKKEKRAEIKFMKETLLACEESGTTWESGGFFDQIIDRNLEKFAKGHSYCNCPDKA